MPRQNNFDKYLEDYGITDRVSHLRDVYFQAMPEICIERPSLITKYSNKNSLFGKERISILDKAKMYRYVLEKRKPVVRHKYGFESRGPGKKMRRFTFSDTSLFAGSTTSKFKGVPIFPEFLGLSIWPELQAISTRQKNPYQLNKKDARTLNEQVFPHWMGENILEKTRSGCRDNVNDPVGISLLQHIVFFMATKTNCISHTIPDFKRVVGEGLDEIIREAEGKRKDTDDAAKQEFYSAIIEVLKGIIAYSTNLAKEAERLALKEDHPVKKQELLDIAEIHRHIPRHPARTFREGLTAIWICWTAIHLENPNVGLSLGRLDQVLYDLYAKDINNTLSMENALELICCLWLKIGDHVPMIPDAGEQLFGGTGSNQAITIGGVQPNDTKIAQDAVNELTYVMLRATELMMLRDPNLNARYHEGAHDDDYLKRLCDSNLKTKATPALHNDKAVIKALMSQGETLAQARDYSIVGCVEPVSSGRAYTASSSIMLNLTSILELALFNGRHRHTRDQLISFETGNPAEPGSFESFNQFKEAFKTQLVWMADVTTSLNDNLGKTHQLYYPTPILSALFEGPMDKGKDIIQGGAKINASGVTIIGLADVADSLSAIEHVVYKTKKATLSELIDAINSNFENNPVLHKLVLESPKYGNEDHCAEANVTWLTGTIHDTFQAKTTYRNGKYRVGYWSMTNHAGFGRLTGALPNGRKAHENFASGITPVSGATPVLTATLNGIAAIPAQHVTNGMAFNIKYTPEENKATMLDNFTASVKGFFDDLDGQRDGGMEIQFNINDHNTFLNAAKHPEQNRELLRDLLVRVSGYTAYFKDLNPQMQKEIIERTEYDLTTGQMKSFTPFQLAPAQDSLDLSWLDHIPESELFTDKLLELLLRGMDMSFMFSRGYRRNIKKFNARYLFVTKDNDVIVSAMFENGNMKVSGDTVKDWDVKVIFSNEKALLEFLFSQNQDILNSLLENNVELQGNVNYIYRFGFLAKDLKHRIVSRSKM